MSDADIETYAFLFILFSGIAVFSYTVGWWIFLRTFKMVDDYLQDRHFRKKGWDKMIGQDGKVWYVGYDDLT